MKILPFIQMNITQNMQYANCCTVLSFCDYIISLPMYQKRPKLKGRFVLIYNYIFPS